MDHLVWQERPQLRRPILIAAFEGWNDAGEAATMAARYLASRWDARPFATLEPEDFYDFTVVRPMVRLVDDGARRIDWPANLFSAATLPGTGRDVIVLHGTEPQLRWRTFTGAILEVARDLGAEMLVTLGALLADVAHTRPVRVTGTAADPALAGRLGLHRSRYEGPTGIVGVLHDTFTGAGVASASLWANVPHYVSQTPSPKAALALVERAATLLGVGMDATDLSEAATSYEREVSEVVAGDDDVADYVRRLELSGEEEPDETHLPSAEHLAAEVERFLREQGGA